MIQFDLRNSLQFNVDFIYAHGEAESIIESDLISCNIDFNLMLIENQICNAVLECTLRYIPAIAVVWEVNSCTNRMKAINNEFNEKKEILDKIQDLEAREFGMRLAKDAYLHSISLCVREHKGFVCLQSDKDAIQDALSKRSRSASFI